MTAVTPKATEHPLQQRILALLAGGWVTGERQGRAVRQLLDGGGLLTPSADPEEVVAALEVGARAARRLGTDADAAVLRARLDAMGAQLCIAGGDGYPAQLHQLWPQLGAPLWLSVAAPGGRLPVGPAVAVVGTREATHDGVRTAEALGRLLGRHGITVVSGCARGIDQAAHRAALAVGGRTVGVLGTGLSVDYPKGTGSLRRAIAESGGLATEHLPDDPPRSRHFLARNRIISGLADAVVVVEGGPRSGALHTARLGVSQGRDVWAVPGSLNAWSSGAPLALIRDGAQVLTALDDVLTSIAATAWATPDAQGWGPTRDVTADGSDNGGARPPVHGLGDTAADVLALLGATPASAGALAALLGTPVPRVLAAISELTARGLAVATARGLVRG